MVAMNGKVLGMAVLAACAQGARKGHKTRRANSTMVDCYSPYDGKALLSLKECASPAEVVSKVEKSGCTIVSEAEEILHLGCDDAYVVCGHEAVADLMEIADVVNKDAGAYWRGSSGTTVAFEGPSTSANFFSSWQGLDAQVAQVESLVASSGGIATIETAGQSLQGRAMKIVRFRGAGYSPGGTRIFVTFNIHAREWITGMSGVYAVENLIEKVRQDSSYLAGTEVVLMPMANPDGFLYSSTSSRMHRKNMANYCTSSNRGVDLNRNFRSYWNQGGSSSDSCSDVFHGPRAASEPETQVIENVMKESPLSLYIDVHSYSQLIISSWGYTTADHPRKTEYREVGGLIQSAIRSVGGNTWTEGAIAQTLYAASGGTTDTAADLGALGICFELRPGRWGGGGFAPPASDILIGARECFAGLTAAFDYAMNPPAPPAPTPAPAPGSWVVEGSGCAMSGNCISSNNHPSNYGNSEQCRIQLAGSVDITVEAFNTESRYDYLTVGGSRYAGTSGPRSGSYSGTISWSSDSSVTKSGWKLCKA